MSRCTGIASYRSLLALDAQVNQARLALQQMSERDPAFERRVKQLLQLVEKRDRVFECASKSRV